MLRRILLISCITICTIAAIAWLISVFWACVVFIPFPGCNAFLSAWQAQGRVQVILSLDGPTETEFFWKTKPAGVGELQPTFNIG